MKDFDKKIFAEWGRAAASVTVMTALLLLACVMCGCRTRCVPAPEYHAETLKTDTAIYNAILRMMRESVRSNQMSSDSLTHFLRETTTLNEQGDTTRHDRVEYIYLSSYKEKEYERMIEEQRDSIGILNARLESVKQDSIPVPYPVERKLTKWERTKMDFGGIAFGGLGVSVIIIALLAWLARKRKK